MVSRRNYFAMLLTILILFFMFQFTGIAKDALNEYGVNEYADIPSAQLTAESMYQAEGAAGDRPYILFVGGADSEEIASVVRWWCTYTKRGFAEQGDIAAYRIPEEGLPQAAVIDGRGLDLRSALPVFRAMAERGIHLIFARLPETDELRKHPGFRSFVGIRELHRERVVLSGVHLFEGFLLGGERIYEEKPGEEERMDLDLEVPWIMTGEGTKTYMMGLVENGDSYKNEMLPALVWRKSVENARVFCVNTDALSHMYGIGFLSAMMAEADSCEIYPVVNAQTLSVVNFSGFAEENGQRMRELYSQSQPAVYRELIWPMLVSLTGESNLKMTLFAVPQLDYADSVRPDGDLLTYYLKLLKEAHGELAVSADAADAADGADLAEKLSGDARFYQQNALDYAMLSVYVKDAADVEEIGGQPLLAGVRTITAPPAELPAVSYYDSDTTLQVATGLAESHRYSDDLALMGIETALGYTNIVLDLKQVSDPPSPDYYWENLSRSLSQNIVTYWRNYRCFSGTTVAESDARIRRFLALDYRVQKQEGRIVLERNEGDGPAWFMLKVNGRTVERMEGGSYEALKGGFYLIEMEGREAVIELEEEQVMIHE